MTHVIIVVHGLSSKFFGVTAAYLGMAEGAGGISRNLWIVGGGGEDFPDAVDPVKVLGFHQHGAETGYSFAVALHAGGEAWEKTHRQIRDREVQAALGGGSEDGPGFCGHFADAGGARSKDYDVEFGSEGWNKAVIRSNFFVEGQSGGAAAGEALRKFAVLF